MPPRVAQVNQILARHQASVRRLFSRGEAGADRDRARGEKAALKEPGDLNLYYLLTFRKKDDAMLVDADQDTENGGPMYEIIYGSTVFTKW